MEFHNLPLLAKTEIFSYLPTKDKKTARKVCKDWAITIDHYGRFFNVEASTNDSNFGYILRTKLPINHLYISKLASPWPLKHLQNPLGVIANLKALSIGANCMDNVVTQCMEYETISIANLRNILLNSCKLEALKFGSFALTQFGNGHIFRDLSLDNLRSLTVTVYGGYLKDQHNSLLTILTDCYFRSLRKLILCYGSLYDYPLEKYFKIYYHSYNFIARHHASLKYLTVRHGGVDWKSSKGTDSKWVQSLSDLEKINEIRQQLERVSLEFLILELLNLRPIGEDVSFVPNYDLMLALGQTNLSHLCLEGRIISPEFEEVVKRNAKTLVCLEIGSDDEPFSLDLSNLKQASNINSLVLSRCKTINFENLPRSLEQLSLSDNNLTKQDLLWIASSLKNLRQLKLVCMGFKMEKVTFGTFRQVLQYLQKLEYIVVDCQKDNLSQHMDQLHNEGWTLQTRYGGRIRIIGRPTKQ